MLVGEDGCCEDTRRGKWGPLAGTITNAPLSTRVQLLAGTPPGAALTVQEARALLCAVRLDPAHHG